MAKKQLKQNYISLHRQWLELKLFQKQREISWKVQGLGLIQFT